MQGLLSETCWWVVTTIAMYAAGGKLRPKNIGLGPRLFLIAAVALLPALATIFYNEVVFRQARSTEVQQAALRIAQLASLELDRIISGSEGTLRAMARAPAVRGFVEETCGEYLRDLSNDLPQFNAFSALDSEGNLRCRSNTATVRTGFQNRPYFQRVMSTGQFVVGEYVQSPNDGMQVVPLATPILDSTGSTIGVLVGGLSLDWLGNRLKEREFAADSSLTIADRNGTIIAREPQPERFVGTTIPGDFQYLVRAAAPGALELVSQDGTERIQGYYPVSVSPHGLYISAGLSKSAAFIEINDATQRTLILAALAAALAFATSILLARTLVRDPIRRILDTITRWRSGETDARTMMHSTGAELDAVGVAVDEFLDELSRAREQRIHADQHRELLNHELQHRVKNMLATVQAVASQTFVGDRRAEQLAIFGQRLAAMANAQSILVTENWQAADLGQVVATAISLFDDRVERFDVAGQPLMVSSKAAMSLSMAIHELATNAVKYGALSGGAGRIEVKWSITHEDEPKFVFRWRETGGPAVVKPEKSGFGTTMISRLLALELSGTVALDYLPGGLECIVEAPAIRVGAIGDQSNDFEAKITPAKQ